MAKIKMSPLVTDIKGSADKLLFSSSRGVATVRTKKTPVQPNTIYQEANKDAMRSIMLTWKEIIESLRNNWIEASQGLGKTGTNLFVSANIVAAKDKTLYKLSMPSSTLKASGPAQYQTSDLETVSVAFSPSPVPAGHRLLFHYIYMNPVSTELMKVSASYIMSGLTSPQIVALPEWTEEAQFMYLTFWHETTYVAGESHGAPIIEI